MFTGVRFVLIGFDSISEAQYRSEIVNAGGVDVGRYDDSCTHVIVHDLVYDDPVCVAVRHDGKTLVTSLWVEDSLELGKLADANRVLYQPVKDLKGISGSDSMCICLTGYQKPQRDDIMKMVDLMGAQFSKPLIAAKVTHLVCYKFEGEKYELAKRTKMKLVNHRWLEDCLKSWDILPVDGYNKSGWEIELMEAQASDSEKETENDVTELAKLQNGLICGSPGPRMPLRELYMIDQRAMAADARSCDPEESIGKNRLMCMSEKETRSDKFNDIVDTIGRNKLASVPDRVSKFAITLGTDEFHKIEVSELGNQSFNFDAEDEKCYLAKEAFMSDGEGILDERPANADKETHKFSPNMSRNKIASSLKPSDEKTPGSFEKVAKILPSGSLVDDFKGNPKEVEYLNANSHALPLEDCIMTEAGHGSIDGDGTPVGQFSNSKGGLSINKKNKKRSSHLEVANGNHKSINISKKTFKKSPDRGSTYRQSSSTGFIDKRSIEGISDNSMINGAHSDGKFRSPGTQISCVAEAKQGLMQEPTITDDRKVHDSVVTPSPLNSGSKNAAEALSRNVGSSETLQSPVFISEPQSGRHNSSSSFENSNSANSIMNQTLNLPKAKCVSLKKPLKRGRTILQAKSSDTSKELTECNKKEQSPDTFLEDVAQLKSDSNCNDAPVKMNPHSNARSGEMGKLLEVEVSFPKDSNYKICELEAHGDVNVHPAATFRKKTYAKKSTGIGRKLSTAHFIKHEKNNSGVSNVNTKEAELDARKQEGSGFEEVISNEADVSRMNQVKQGKLITSRAVDLEAYVDAEKENRQIQSVNVDMKPDKKGFQKAVAKSSSTKTKVISKKVVHHQPACFILSGHRLQRKEFQQIIRRLRGKFCRDSHQWSYQATHLIVPDPVRRTEKFFAATAAGRWVLKEDYLIASNQAGRFVEEDTYEWYGKGLNGDGSINMEAPRKWRLLRERSGHGAFYGMRIIVYGECIAPSLDTLKRAVKAGDGVILATSPPYSRFLKLGIDFAIVGAGMPPSDCWIQYFLKHEIPCVAADYLVEYVCKFGYPFDRHVLYDTHSWVERSMQNLVTRAEEIVKLPSDDACEDEDIDGANDDDDVACLVCGSRDRGEVMLICGDERGSLGCGAGSHIDCCDPPFEAVPEDDWFCPQCAIDNGSRYRSTNISSKNRS